MKLRKLAVVLCGGLILGSAGTIASADKYASVFGGYTNLKDLDFQVAPGTVSTEFDDGWAFGVALGTKLGQAGAKHRWRVEGEISLRSNDVESHKLNDGATLAGSKGELKSTALMFNALIDFNEAAKVSPYLGAGIGLAKVDASDFGVDAIPGVLDDSATVLAYQLIAGVGWGVSERTDLFAEYRYFATEDASVTTSAATGSVGTDLAYRTNNVMIGARFGF